MSVQNNDISHNNTKAKFDKNICQTTTIMTNKSNTVISSKSWYSNNVQR